MKIKKKWCEIYIDLPSTRVGFCFPPILEIFIHYVWRNGRTNSHIMKRVLCPSFLSFWAPPRKGESLKRTSFSARYFKIVSSLGIFFSNCQRPGARCWLDLLGRKITRISFLWVDVFKLLSSKVYVGQIQLQSNRHYSRILVDAGNFIGARFQMSAKDFGKNHLTAFSLDEHPHASRSLLLHLAVLWQFKFWCQLLTLLSDCDIQVVC